MLFFGHIVELNKKALDVEQLLLVDDWVLELLQEFRAITRLKKSINVAIILFERQLNKLNEGNAYFLEHPLPIRHQKGPMNRC